MTFYEEILVDWFWDSSKSSMFLQNTQYALYMTKLTLS